MRENGIFLTFISFLLVSTLLALSISISQAGIGAEKNLAEETAYKSVNNAFSNIRQQTTIAKEGYASVVYGRIMPFSSFKADENWIEIGQDIADSGEYLKNTYDALNLFAVFAEKKWQEGMQVNIKSVIHGKEWDINSEDYPQLTYLVLPQCLKFSTGGASGTSMVRFEGGGIADGCTQAFNPASIESQEAGISLDYSDYQHLKCHGVFSSGGNECVGADNGNPELPYYAEISITLENCGTPCSESGFDQNGRQTISANLAGGNDDYIQVDLTGGQNFKLEFSNYMAEITSGEDRINAFSTKIVFTEPFDEIVLAPGQGQFDFGIKNTGFGVCRATSEEACADEGTSLIAYYKFNEGIGPTTTDSSGNYNSGTLLPAGSGPAWQTIGCHSGNCLVFDGVNNYVQVSDSSSLDLTNNFTIALWVKPGNLTQTNKYILSKLGPGDNAYAIIWEYLNDNIEFYSSSYTGSNPRTGSNIPITNTNWHHIVYTYNGSTWAGYRDGENIFSLSRTFSLNASTGNLLLGTYNGSGSWFFNGTIDEARIYNRALSPAEILALYNQ